MLSSAKWSSWEELWELKGFTNVWDHTWHLQIKDGFFHLFMISSHQSSWHTRIYFNIYLSMATHSSTLAWKLPWMEEPGRLQSMWWWRVRHDWATSLSLFTFLRWRRKWQPTPVFLPWRIPGTGEPGGLPSVGSHRVRHDWSYLAAAAAVTCLWF